MLSQVIRSNESSSSSDSIGDSDMPRIASISISWVRSCSGISSSNVLASAGADMSSKASGSTNSDSSLISSSRLVGFDIDSFLSRVLTCRTLKASSRSVSPWTYWSPKSIISILSFGLSRGSPCIGTQSGRFE